MDQKLEYIQSRIEFIISTCIDTKVKEGLEQALRVVNTAPSDTQTLSKTKEKRATWDDWHRLSETKLNKHLISDRHLRELNGMPEGYEGSIMYQFNRGHYFRNANYDNHVLFSFCKLEETKEGKNFWDDVIEYMSQDVPLPPYEELLKKHLE